MKLKRKAREIALKALFAIEVGKNTIPDAFLQFRFEDPVVKNYALELVNGTLKNKSEIDKEIISLLQNWSIDRISEVDKQILRLAIYQINKSLREEVGLVVFEMVELARKYGDSESNKFVNGILRAFIRKRENEEKA